MKLTALFPKFPEGFWRRIELRPGPGRVVAGLEDNVHRFHLTLSHDGESVTRMNVETPRVPASTCPAAGPYIASELEGQRLALVARRDPAEHCTHLLDLAVLAANHAADDEPARYDMWVADRVEGRTTALLLLNDVELIRWELNGTEIVEPPPFAGRNLKRLSLWKCELSAAEGEHATLLRRAVMVSGSRAVGAEVVGRSVEFVRSRIGACFTYHEDRAFDAVRSLNWQKDFGRMGEAPLADFDAMELGGKA